MDGVRVGVSYSAADGASSVRPAGTAGDFGLNRTDRTAADTIYH